MWSNSATTLPVRASDIVGIGPCEDIQELFFFEPTNLVNLSNQSLSNAHQLQKSYSGAYLVQVVNERADCDQHAQSVSRYVVRQRCKAATCT